jgi:hypothetical protein
MAAPSADDLDADSIAVAAQQPAKAEVDGVKVEVVPIPDQIAADRYRRTQAALPASGGSAWGCVRTARVQPPGTTG